MSEHDRDLERRLAAIELHVARLGETLAESMVLQAEFMTWAARLGKIGVQPAHPGEAVEFSQRMLTEAGNLVQASRTFLDQLKALPDIEDAP